LDEYDDINSEVQTRANNLLMVMQWLHSGYLGTIPILRQQRDWVVGVRKWQFLLMFSTIYADVK
jgi:hypothetical protein